MAPSFLQRLFSRKKRGSDARLLSLGEITEGRPKSGAPSSDATRRRDRGPQESAAKTRSGGVAAKVRLFAFVDPKDPFAAGEITGEEIPGPILAIMNDRHFDAVFLFCTGHTKENAAATEKELSRRYPECRVSVLELPITDPKNYLSLMRVLAQIVRKVVQAPYLSGLPIENYVCVSSGTAEMRASWFFLSALGVLPAKLLQVGLLEQQLLGRANVSEVRTETSDWQTIREAAMRGESISSELMGKVKELPPDTVVGPLGGPRWPSLKGRKPKAAALRKEPEAGLEIFGFDNAFVERMRTLYGDPLTNLLPGLRRKFLSRGLPLDSVQALTDETLRRVAAVLRARKETREGEFWIDGSEDVLAAVQAHRAVRQPESFAALVNSISNSCLLKYYRLSGTSPETVDFDIEAPDVLNELKLTPSQLEGLQQGMPAEDLKTEKVPLGAKEEKEESVSNDTRRKETLESQNEAIDEGPTQEPPREEAAAAAEKTGAFLFGEIEPESPQTQNEATQAASAETEDDLQAIVDREGGRLVPGLDDALQELGIHVGSAVLRHAAERAGIAAESDLPVLLLGETGTGKERFAHLIHRMSPRGSRDLVAVNCAAIPESLAESYLFGYMRGAFSGASSDKKGMFESADQSTLFLDEVAELSLEVQAKLLRVIQDGVVQRIGSTAPRRVDVRVIAASNRDLRDQVRAGLFREDLYFRLEVVQVKLPALRERRSEIPGLALALLHQINLRRHRPRRLSSAALMRLEKFDWPGNVRQLSNVLERSVLYARDEGIDADDLLITDDNPDKVPFVALPELSDGFKLEKCLAQIRNQLFLQALEACKGNQSAAAEMLGVSKQAVSKFVQGQNDNEN
jgi:transcriptional regulator with PAS, ATPase and Fis domain